MKGIDLLRRRCGDGRLLEAVWHILSDGDFTLVLMNARHVENVPGRKTDVNDATWLADLLAHGQIRGSFVPDAETQVLRNLLRTRKQLVRERSSHIQRLQKTLEDADPRQWRAGGCGCRQPCGAGRRPRARRGGA